MNAIIPVILAGGTGKRLWPLSRPERPKQFLSITGNETMLQQTALRAQTLTTENPIIITHQDYIEIAHEQMAAQNIVAQFLLEPIARNTALAIACAAQLAQKRYSNAIILVLPADHYIGNLLALRDAIFAALPAADAGKLMTLGITPNHAATEYGYILRGNFMAATPECHHVKKFVEKPNRATAEEYFQNSEWLWNSGIFLMRSDIFLCELKYYAPNTYEAAQQAMPANKSNLISLLLSAYTCAPDISIDYAVMEHTQHAGVISCNPGWSDIGSFAALHQLGEQISLHPEVADFLAQAHNIADAA